MRTIFLITWFKENCIEGNCAAPTKEAAETIKRDLEKVSDEVIVEEIDFYL